MNEDNPALLLYSEYQDKLLGGKINVQNSFDSIVQFV